MNTKTVKEKVEDIVANNLRYSFEEVGRVQVILLPKALDKIDKLYRKEMIKLIESKTHACSIDAYDLGNICNSDELIKLI